MQDWKNLQYLSGFGNEFATEDSRNPNALPVGQVISHKLCSLSLFKTFI